MKISVAADEDTGVGSKVVECTAGGARTWNDANVPARSQRLTSQAELGEVLDAWLAGAPRPDADDQANIAHVDTIRPGP